MKKEEFNIPSNIIKLLYDKSNDKRKLGMKELDLFLRDEVNFNSEDSIYSAIKSFKSLTEIAEQQNIRRAAFLGYTTLANIIKQNEKNHDNMRVINQILNNILYCFKDNDSKVVCSAAESLYNLMKYFPNLLIQFFNDVFEGLLLINLNPDQEVRTLAQNLDSQFKEIINFTLQDNDLSAEFNLKEFFQKIYEKISAKHPSVKLIIVSWISFINSIPEIKIINVLHEFLASLFNMLSEKQKEINQSAENCLKDILKEIDTFFDSLSYDVEVKILEILIIQCKSTQDQSLLTSFEWIIFFLTKYKFFMIQNKNFLKNPKKLSINFNKWSANRPSNLNSPRNIHSDNIITENMFKNEDSCTRTTSVSDIGERKIPYNLFSRILDIIISSINHSNIEIRKFANDANNILLTIVEFYGENSCTNIKLFEEVLKNYINTGENEGTLQILELALTWINKLFKKFHEEMFCNVDDFVRSISNILSHPNENLFNSVLEIICDIAKYRDEYIEVIFSIFLERLFENQNLLKNKATIILKKFCDTLSVNRVYSTFAEVLIKMKKKDRDFVGRMINILDLFLVTGEETQPLRNTLRNLNKNSNLVEKQFFEKIFRTWCLNPISSLILCLLAEQYELSNFLLVKIGELNLSQEHYVELAQLVQLLESTVFMYIRIDLLEPRKNIYLIKSLFGILLMLPQGKAYQALYKRLKHIEVIYKLDISAQISIEKTDTSKIKKEDIQHYLKIFDSSYCEVDSYHI